MHAVAMNVVLIPFFLAARLTLDSAWKHGPEYVFQVLVNSTAIPEEEETTGSVRLNLASKLICQPKATNILSCHFEDSKANSFVSESHDPDVAAIPITEVSRQKAYEISQDQFEMKFSERGLDSLLVNEDVQPRELDMIRVIVGQLHVGAILRNKTEDTFEVMENYTQGECATTFVLDRKIGWRSFGKRSYSLETAFGLRDNQILQIRKVRNLYMCTHKIPYFFGSAESLREVSDILSAVTSSESHITITRTEFVSGTSNVITTSTIDEPVLTTLYENISLRLESINPAKSEPPEIRNAEYASIFIGSWLMDSSFEEDS